MNAKAMEPFGMALLAYFEGDATAEFIIRREDGQEVSLPASFFFRDPSNFTPIENSALGLCAGHVLDAGAGTGLHSLVLQEMGLAVISIDVSPHAASIMKQRGLKNVHCADVLEFKGGPFDTLLMMGHGIGMVETINGLDRFLSIAQSLLTREGQLLLDSLDVRVTENPADLAYHEVNRKAGRYIGEIRMQFTFQGNEGPYCGWLQVDSEMIKARAELAGWKSEVVLREESGNYLTRITKKGSA